MLLCLSCLPRKHLITGVTGQAGGGATLHLQARPLVGGQFHCDVRRAPTAFSGDRGQGRSRLCVRPPVSPGAAEGPGRQGQGAPMGLASQARMCFKGTRTEVAASARVTHPGPRKGTQTEPQQSGTGPQSRPCDRGGRTGGSCAPGFVDIWQLHDRRHSAPRGRTPRHRQGVAQSQSRGGSRELSGEPLQPGTLVAERAVPWAGPRTGRCGRGQGEAWGAA